MDAAQYRYTGNTLIGDYARAGVGFLVCAAPLVFTTVNWMTILLGCLAILFLAFGIKTAIRHQTVFTVDGEGVAAVGPFGRQVRWRDLDSFKLAYYATKRDKEKSTGWMEATLGGPGGKVKVDSTLEGFHDIVEHATKSALANGVALARATRANLKAMDIPTPGLEDDELQGGRPG